MELHRFDRPSISTAWILTLCQLPQLSVLLFCMDRQDSFTFMRCLGDEENVVPMHLWAGRSGRSGGGGGCGGGGGVSRTCSLLC